MGPDWTDMFINWLYDDLGVCEQVDEGRKNKKNPPQITDKVLVDFVNAADEIR